MQNLARQWPLIAVLLGGLVGGLLALPLLGYHFAWDQAVYAAVADKLLDGGIVYRDGWEFRPPGGFYATYAAFLLFGRSELAVRILEVLCMAFSSAGLVRFGQSRFGSSAAGLVAAAALPLLYLPFGHWHTAEPESFQLPFLVWGFALWPRGAEERPERRCGVSGLLIGIAFLTKTTIALPGFVLVLDRLLMDAGKSGRPQKLRLAAVSAAAMAAPAVAVALYYTVRGAGPELYDAIFVFSPNYVRLYSDFSLSWHVRKVPEMIAWCLPFWASAGAVFGALRGFVFRRTDAAWTAVLFLSVLAGVMMQSKYIQYHLIPLLPFLSLAIGLGAAWGGPGDAGEVRRRSLLRRASLGVSGLLLSAGALEASRRVSVFWGDLRRSPEQRAHEWVCWSYHEQSAELAATIRELTKPDEKIFLWANHPLPYFLSDRKMAGPYTSIFLATAPWVGNSKVDDLVRRFEVERPRLIIVGYGDELWQKGESWKLLDRFPQMKSYLLDRYRRLDRPERFQFWIRQD